jgi:serine/threonine protein phosphatase PrpC
LTDLSGRLPNAGEAIASDPEFLSSQSFDVTNPGLEVGTPFIDATGHLTGLRSAKAGSPIKLEAISPLVKGIQTNQQLGNNLTPTATSAPSGPFVIPGTNFSLGLWPFITLILLFLALGGLLAALVIRSRRGQTNRLSKAEWDEAERRAAVLAREIETMETARRDWAEHQSLSEQPTIPVQPQGLQDKTVMRKTATDLRCPRCGEPVVHDANYCPNCSLFLSPSESGLHLRVRPASSSLPAQSPTPANPFANSNSRAVPPTSAPTPMFPGSSLADQPTIPPLPIPMSPTDAMADHPTVEITPTVTRKIVENIYDDNTVPSSLRQMQTKRLGFAVGTNSNPGIKRKYKPNEDSLLAAQGLVGSAPGPQPFGLFVIADGMGGHANGQDASRLAIQMIVENVLPKLVSDRTGSVDYAEVLAGGIQSANQAVHQQNMDKRGDMGTTVTSALVVGPFAYVANVGDSRTYLYREAEGLRKVTNDHSVVASLVEAGIIKPDDIYTHPKRNQIYRSLGEKAVVDVDKFTVQLREGDKLLLCSDGLWDMVRDPKIEEVVGRPVSNPSIIGDDLIQSALEGGGEDNVSVIVVQITEGGNPEALPRVQLLAKPENVQMPQF